MANVKYKYQCYGCGYVVYLDDEIAPFKCPNCDDVMQYMVTVDEDGNMVLEDFDDE